MKIQNIIFLVFILTLGSFILMGDTVQRFIVFPTYKKFDQQESARRVRSSIKALEMEINHLDLFNSDWAASNDTYEFIENRNVEYIESNLGISSFTDNKVNSIIYLDLNGNLVWGKSFDHATGKPIEIDIFSERALSSNNILFTHKDTSSFTTGVILTDVGPMLVSSRPVTSSDSRKQIRGSLIIARFFGSELLGALRKVTDVNFDFWTVSKDMQHFHQGVLCPDPKCLFELTAAEVRPELDVLNEITSESPVVVREKDNGIMVSYAFKKDILSESGLLFMVQTPMDITATSRKMLTANLLFNIFVGLIVLIIVLQIIKFHIFIPIKNLTDQVEQIRTSGSVNSKIADTIWTNNEVGFLTQEFNLMITRLSEAQRQMVDRSYFSGMSEVTSGVMHNVRNAMNPLIADIDFIREELSHLPIEHMRIAKIELAGEATKPTERKNLLLDFIVTGIDHFEMLASGILVRLNRMNHRIATIEKILQGQEKFASTGITLSGVDLTSIIKNAMLLISFDFHIDIDIVLDDSLKNSRKVYADKNALIHIFTNLLNNAIESIFNTGRVDGKIHLSSKIEIIGKNTYQHIVISDNGYGIPEEYLTKIFNRGFSTKKTRASGIGLHWCANTLTTMKGKIYAESDGHQSGATIHVLIPAY